MVRTSCGRSPSSATAVFSAFSTPKSTQPGHQSGSALPLKSLTDSGARRGFVFGTSLVSITGSAIIALPSSHDLVNRDVLLLARERLADALHDGVGHEGLAVVLPDVRVGDDAGLRPQVARELPA